MRCTSRLLVMGLLAVCACGKDDKRAPYGPSDGMGGVDVVAVGRDGGKPADDEDSGQSDADTPDAGSDAAVAFESCERIQGVQGSGTADMTQITSTTMPSDFLVTRQSLRWSSDCEKPTLTLELSDGVCPYGGGHQLSIELSVNAIEDGMIQLGNNPVTQESEQNLIKVRYVRPLKLKPRGSWGTCDAASGVLLFGEAPVLQAGNVLQGYFQLDLTACDDATTGTMSVVGTFNVKLRSALNEVCPNRMR